MTQHEKERVKVLLERAAYLEKIVKDFPNHKNANFYKREAKAIRWAVEIVIFHKEKSHLHMLNRLL